MPLFLLFMLSKGTYKEQRAEGYCWEDPGSQSIIGGRGELQAFLERGNAQTLGEEDDGHGPQEDDALLVHYPGGQL